jgi:hypothetical protein
VIAFSNVELQKLSIKEIKAILQERKVDMSDCIEKGDMVC